MALDDKLLTLEDFNTWELKYRYNNNIRYRIPIIETHTDNDEIPPLYVEKDNQMSDVIGLPDGIEYRVYYHNKLIETFYVPSEFSDNYDFRVITESSYDETNDVGYINSDVTITVPVDFKHVETVDDFNNYNYIIFDENDIENTDFIIDNDVTIFSNSKAFDTCNITINGDVTIEGNISLIDTIITVNGTLTFKNGRVHVENYNDNYSIVNNNNLIINNSRLDLFSGLCINNESLELTNSTINPLSTSTPLIYDRGNYNIKSNVFNFFGDYDEFGLCILRTDNIDTFNIFSNNTFEYINVVLTLSDVDYNITHDEDKWGFAYTMVHNDSIKLYNLRV